MYIKSRVTILLLIFGQISIFIEYHINSTTLYFHFFIVYQGIMAFGHVPENTSLLCFPEIEPLIRLSADAVSHGLCQLVLRQVSTRRASPFRKGTMGCLGSLC